MPSPGGIATVLEPRDPPAVRRARNWRRVGLTLLLLLIVLGLAGVLGVRSGTTTASAEGYRLAVEYPRVVRAGLAAPFHIEVRRDLGFDGPITLAISAGLFERFDFQNFYPNPAAETASAAYMYYEFDPPPGDTFRVSLDARTAPDQNGSTAVYQVRLLDDDGRPVATTSFRMWVAP